MKKHSAAKAFAKAAGFSKAEEPFDLDREVAQAYKDFPELKGNTYFIDAVERRLVHPRVTKKLQSQVMDNWKVRREASAARKALRSHYLIGKQSFLPFNAVFFAEGHRDDLDGIYPPGYTNEQTKRAIFDHELGHALTLRRKRDRKDYGDNRHVEETMADAFMLLRQFQRYGDSGVVQERNLIAKSATDFLFGSEEHQYYFSGPALEKIVSLKERFNGSAISPRQMVSFARTITLQHSAHRLMVQEIKRELKKAGKEGSLEKLAKAVLATESEETFKWGSMTLRYVMDAGMNEGLIHPAKVRAFREKHWPEVLRGLDGKERVMFSPSKTANFSRER